MSAATDEDRGTEELPYLTTTEIAYRYRRDVTTIIGWINNGVLTPAGRVWLRAERVGGRWLIKPRDLIAFIKAANPEAFKTLAQDQEAAHEEGQAAAERLGKRLGKDRSPKK